MLSKLKQHIKYTAWGGVIIVIYNLIHPIKGKNNRYSRKGCFGKPMLSVTGNNNVVDIKGSSFKHTEIRINGSNNTLIIEEGCIIGEGCSFWLEGNDNLIRIGKNVTMTSHCHFNAQEHKTSIIVGDDCMFSNTIVVRTSDSHPIYNDLGERINMAKDIHIMNHVWIAPKSVIMKGAVVGDGCVIGQYSLVNKQIPKNCLAVGMPAKVVKENIRWTREDVLK